MQCLALELKLSLTWTTSELTRRYRRCRNVKERTRWLAIRLLSRPHNPMTVEQVADITGFSPDWVRKIARRYNRLGPEGLIDGHQQHPGGKKQALTRLATKATF